MKEYPVLILALAVFLGASLAGLTAEPAPYEDNARYVIVARSLLAGRGLAKLNFPGEPADVKIAPLYPAFLAGLMAVFGPSLLPLKLSSLAFMLAGLFLFLLIMRGAGIDPVIRLAVTAAAAAQPYLLEYSRPILSEAGFLCGLLFGVWLLVRYEGTAQRRFALAALCCAVALFFWRQIGIVLPVAASAVLVKKRDRGLACLAICLCLALAGIWVWRNLSVPDGYLRELLSAGTYLAPAPGRIGAAGMLARYAYEAAAYIGDVVPDFLFPALRAIAPHARSWILKIAAGALACALVLAGYVRLWRRGVSRAMLLVPAVYALLLPFFPSYGMRYLVPAGLWLILCLFEGMSGLRANRPARLAVAGAACVILLSAPVALQDIRANRKGFAPAWRNYYRALYFVRDHAPADAVVACRKPFLGYLLSGRRTLGYPYTRDVRAMRDHLRAGNAAYVVVDSLDVAGTVFGRAYLAPAVEAYPHDFRRVFAVAGPQTEVYVLDEHRVSD